MMKDVWRWLLIGTLGLLLTGCCSWVDQDQPQHDVTGEFGLAVSSNVGQTFVAHHAGLNGMDWWLEPDLVGDGELILHLQDAPQSPTEYITATLPLAQVQAPGFYHFPFAPQRDSRDRYYYAFVEVQGSGHVKVGAGPGLVYTEGALYQNHQPQDSQAAFRLTYECWGIGLGLLLAVGQYCKVVLWAGLLFLLPGWALLVGIQRTLKTRLVEHWAEGMGIAIGMGLSIYPLLLLWTDWLRVRLNSFNVWLPLGLSVMALTWYYRPWHWHIRLWLPQLRTWCSRSNLGYESALVIIVLLSGFLRLLIVQGLDLPRLGDSVQHAFIVQRLLEDGGLFQSWLPYAPYATFSQQFGFHTETAVWAWLTGMATPQAILWCGQAMNWLAVLTLFPLGYRIGGRWGGLIVILVAGYWTQFPAYYVNWGRYPQLTGQVLLPVAAWWVWHARQLERPWWPVLVIGGSVVAGMLLSYYRLALHYGAFVLAVWVALLRPGLTHDRRRCMLFAIGMVICAGLLTWPWFYALLARPRLATMLGTSVASSGNNLWQSLQGTNLGWSIPQAGWVFVGTVIGILLSEAAALPVLWVWLLFLLTLLRFTHLPGVSLIQLFTINTSLYIQQALIWGMLGSYGIDMLLAARKTLRRPLATQRWSIVSISLFMVLLSVVRVPIALRVIESDSGRGFRPDVRAARWIESHLPETALFLIEGQVYANGLPGSNTEVAYWSSVLGRHAIGADGGWWLPLLAHRAVTIPPQYTLESEEPILSGYTDAVNNLTLGLFEVTPTSSAGLALICSFPYPITHVYLGQSHGIVNSTLTPGGRSMLPAQELLQSPSFRLIYQQDRVMIFEFDRSICR